MKMDRNFLKYSGLDSACTLMAHDAFWKDVDPEFSDAYSMTTDILPVLMFMQERGILIDTKALEDTKVDVLKSKATKQEELNALCGRELNVNSPKDCCSYFYSELGIPPYKNPQGNPTVDDAALQRLVRGTMARPGLRQAKLVQEIRGLGKLYGTYLNLEFDPDNRLRCSYNPRGTKFGRLSSSKTIRGTGTNFQNLPPEFKKFLVADPGYVFVEVDKRQAEWVVVAYVTGDANMINAVESGLDVHTYTASLMFDAPASIIKYEHKLNGHSTNANEILERRSTDPLLSEFNYAKWIRSMSLRQCGKKSNHGLNYDEGAYQFALINEMEIPEAKKIYNMYHSNYPGIKIWYDSVKGLLQKTRTLTNCFGRTVRFMGAWGEDLWKSAYAMLPQSTVVDSLNKGMVEIYNDQEICGKEGANTDILAQVHDSILMQIPISFLMEERNFNWFLRKITDYTSPDITYLLRTFKIASDYKFGFNWGGYDETGNPEGMQEFDDYESFVKKVKVWEELNGQRTLGVVA